MWPFAEPLPKFNRSEWPHWSDLDRDGDDTLQEVLEKDSLAPISRDEKGRITIGLWHCPYTGRIVTSAKRIDIDHVISLGGKCPLRVSTCLPARFHKRLLSRNRKI